MVAAHTAVVIHPVAVRVQAAVTVVAAVVRRAVAAHTVAVIRRAAAHAQAAAMEVAAVVRVAVAEVAAVPVPAVVADNEKRFQREERLLRL